jgi:hypothetical protein
MSIIAQQPRTPASAALLRTASPPSPAAGFRRVRFTGSAYIGDVLFTRGDIAELPTNIVCPVRVALDDSTGAVW